MFDLKYEYHPDIRDHKGLSRTSVKSSNRLAASASPTLSSFALLRRLSRPTSSRPHAPCASPTASRAMTARRSASRS